MKPANNSLFALSARLTVSMLGARASRPPLTRKLGSACVPVLICLVSLFLVPEKISHSDSSVGAPTGRDSAPMPALKGQEAIDHLKQQGTYNSLQEAMAAARYEAQWQTTPKLQDLGAAYELKNAANGLLAYVNGDGLQVTSLNDDQTKPWRLGLTLTDYGYGSALSAIQAGEVKAQGNRVSIQKSATGNPQSAIEEWFVNASRGIEHGFTLASRPESAISNPKSAMKALRLRLAVTGDLTASVHGSGATFTQREGNVLLSYNNLFVVDAKGRAVEARMKLEGSSLVIEVEDAEAAYPLTIDPLLTQQQRLTPIGGGDGTFGASIAVSGDTAIVGDSTENSGAGFRQGSAYVFVRSDVSWTQQTKLTANDAAPGDDFGSSVAIEGNTIVVGAPQGGMGGKGSAYVFARSGGSWIQQAKLRASDGVPGSIFGTAVAFSGDTIIVGALYDQVNGHNLQGSAYVFVRSGVSWTEQAKLTASDGAAFDNFGNSVAISGDTVVVGAYADDVNANGNQGSAYVFVRVGSVWTEQQQLTASDGAANDSFGSSVAISGDTIVVGAYFSDIGGNADQGSAYVFVRSGVSWTLQAKLTAYDGAAGDRFGHSVVINGDTIGVGAYLADVSGNTDQGAAYFFTRSGTTWTRQGKLIASDGAANDRFGNAVAISGGTVVVGAGTDESGGNPPGSAYAFVCTWSEQFHAIASVDGEANDRFGNAVAISGDTAVVGAYLDDTFINVDQGSAYVFVRSGVNWTQQAKLLAPDGAGGDQFGTSVAISGDTIVVGAPFDDILASDQGSAYVFTRSGTTWTWQQKLGANDAAAGDLFGFSVAIASDTIIIGAFADTVANFHQGSAYVFVRNGTSWTLQQKLTAIDGLTNDFFGYSVAISGDTVVVGAATDDEVNPDQGSAYVFVRSGTTWTQQGAKLTANDGGSGDQFGFSIALSGDTLVVGAVHDVINGNQDQGSAYVFVRTGATWTQQQKIVAPDGMTFDQLGVSVAINGDTVVLGAQADDETITDQGSAYVYERSGAAWSFRQKLIASDPGNTDLFGFAVAISGDTIVVGAYRDDVAANADQGSAYVFFMGCNTAPTIVAGGGITRQKGSPASTSTIANVSDSEDPIGYLTVSVASAPAGISITSITNTNGVITAQVAALCNATLGNNFVVLRVQDSDGAVGSVQLLINVTPNAAPTLGIYPNTAVAVLGSTIVTPNLIPSDNGNLASLSATSQTFTGILSVDLDTGVVSISNARPGGTHVVTVTAVDNCGVTTTSGFTLTVNCQSITVNPSTIPGGTAGSAYSQVFTQTGGIAPVTFSLTGTLPTGMSFTPGTATLSGTPTQVGNFPITVTATDTNNCAGSRNYTLVIGAMSLVWNGSTSPDWNTASNWTPNAVPTTFNDVLIPTAGVTNQPTISAASSSINAMTIQASRVLTINSSLQLSTAANITTAGTIAGAGKLAFSGLTFTQDGIVSIASVEFGAGSHALTGGGAFASGIVTVLGGASVSLTSNHSLSVLVINSGGSFDCTNRLLTLTGAGTPIFNSGSFTALGSTLVYQGSVAQVVTSNIVYQNLTANNAAGLSLAGDTTVNGQLNLMTDLTTGSFTVTMPASGTSTGTGDVIGNVKRIGFTNGAVLSFGNPFNTIRFDSGTPPTDVNVNLVKSTPSGFNTNTVSRTYTITPNGGSGFSATLRLRYKDTELNGLSESTLELWRYNGSSWVSPAGSATRDTTQNWVEETGISAFSPWAIAGPSGPTEVKLISFDATGYDNGVLVEWRTGFEVDNLGFRIYRQEGGARTLLNQEMVAGSALTAGFGTVLTAGRAYAFWVDARDVGKESAFWLEDIDLNGASTWHGPFNVRPVGGKPPVHSQAESLSQKGRLGDNGSTHPVEAFAQLAKGSQSGSSPASLQQTSLASSRAIKIGVRQAGWYRVTQVELINAGLDPKTDPRTLRLFVDGVETPVQIAGEEDGTFDASDSLEFYGLGLNTPSTDTRVYWLISGSQPGIRITRTPFASGYRSGENFPYTVERRDRSIYFAALRNGDEENFFGAVVTGSVVSQSLTLNNLGPSSESAIIEVSLQGVTNIAHAVSVNLNGSPIGRLAFSSQSKGQEKIEVPQSLLLQGDNVLTLQSLNGPSDVSLVDSIRITYQHGYEAENDRLTFPARGGETATVSGFSSKDIRVFDVTDERNVQELGVSIEPGKDGYAATFTAPNAGFKGFGAGERKLLALTDPRALQASNLRANAPSHLREAGNAADFVIISPANLFDALKPLIDLRSKQGLITLLVDIEDVYDEFNFGDKSPQSVKDFLSTAATRWKIKPRFVLLAGDASYDPRNYLGLGDNDLVPTRLIDTAYLETASDDWFVDFDGDGIADLSIGRLPVGTPLEASIVVSKLIAYEQSTPSNEVALVADRNDGFDFEHAATALRPLMPPGNRVFEIFRSRTDDATAQAQLLEAINRGQRIVNYNGHGSANVWRGDLLTAADAARLNNEHLPVFVMMTCLNGYFDDPWSDSLAESLLKAEHGGAVAVWASSGMTLPVQQSAMNQEFYRLLFSAKVGLTLGEAAGRAKLAVSDADVRRTWILLGDPTMKLK